jgi:hypothetical protein
MKPWTPGILLAAVAMLGLCCESLGCTLFCATGNGNVFFGNNEDSPHAYPSMMWLVPAREGAHGRVCFGWYSFAQGGMNDQGLAIDWAITPPQGREHPDKTPLDASVVERVLANCATVKDALRLFETHAFVNNDAHFMVADPSGDSAVGEWVKGEFRIVRKKGDHQVLTNFLLTDPQAGNYPCERFEKVEKILDRWTWVTISKAVSALKAASAEWETGGTKYSNLYDLSARRVYVYYRRDYDHPLVIDLAKQLAKGFREVDLQEWHAQGDMVLEPKPAANIPAMTTREVLLRAALARGGRDAWLRIQSIHAVGRVELGWTEQGSMELASRRGGTFRQSVSLDGSATFQRGYDGKHAWVSNTYHDVPLFHGKTDSEAHEESEFFGWFDASAGTGNFARPKWLQGRTCYEVQRAGTKTRDYYDAETFLLVGSVGEMMTTTGPTWSMTYYSEYEPAGGFLLPTRIRVKQEGDEHGFRFEKVSINGSFDGVSENPILLSEKEGGGDKQTGLSMPVEDTPKTAKK